MLKPLKRRQVSKALYAGREVSSATFIPYEHHWDKETIITKDKELLQVIKVEGFSFETADDDVVDMKKMVRNSQGRGASTKLVAPYRMVAIKMFSFNVCTLVRMRHPFLIKANRTRASFPVHGVSHGPDLD